MFCKLANILYICSSNSAKTYLGIMKTETIEMSIDDVTTYLKENGKHSGIFYYNAYGWNTYYTLERTFATPTGKLWNEGFPSVVRIWLDGYQQSNTPLVVPIKETSQTKIG